MTLDDLAQVIAGKMTAIENSIGGEVDERLNQRMSDGEFKRSLHEMFAEYIASDSGKEHVRKIRWGADPSDRELVGTKYARMGVSRADIEMLHNIMTAAQESGLNKRGPSEELDKTFQAISSGHYRSTALAKADDERQLDQMREAGRLDALGYERAIRAVEQSYTRAMDTAESGFGSQLIGAQYVGDLWEAARRQSRVFSLFDSFEMTEASTYIPVEVDIPEMLYVGESTSPTASDYTTSKTGSQRVQLTAKKFILHQIYSGELDEDSILPLLGFLRRQAGLSMEHYSDSVVLNGDTTNSGTGNINLDDADPADTKAYLSLDGLRHAWIVDNTANGMNANGAITWSMLNRVRTLMIDDANIVDWGYPTMDGDLIYIADPRTCNYISLLDEVVGMDKYGSNATVLTGEVSRIGRHPLICSQAMRLTEADAKLSTTGGNNTKGQVQVVNRNGFKVGWRRRAMLETERLPGRDQTRLIWSLRFDFGRFTPSGAASGIEASAGIYNISLPS